MNLDFIITYNIWGKIGMGGGDKRAKRHECTKINLCKLWSMNA